MAKKGRGALASALARHQSEEQRRRAKQQKLNNKEIHYPENKKKSKAAAAVAKEDKAETELLPLDEKNVFVPFCKRDRILIVGDGDFSYTLSIVRKKLIKPGNVVTTSYDTLEEVRSKYGATVDDHLQELAELGVTKVYHGIDGTRLAETLGLSVRKKRQGDGSGRSAEVLGGLDVNNVVFNFPHVGQHIKDVERNVRKNQELLAGFFRSCREFYSILRRQRELHAGSGYRALEHAPADSADELEDEGPPLSATPRDVDVVTVTLFTGEPYDSWKVKKLARDEIGYSVQRSGRLEWRFFDGYAHRRTAGLGDTNRRASSREARIYKFERYDAARHGKGTGKKRRRGDDDDSDSDDDGE